MTTRALAAALLLAAGWNLDAAAQRTLYLAPDGSDGAAGTARSAAWRTFDRALPALRAGDTLVLLDGVYEPGSVGRFFVDCDEAGNDGTAAAPITVRSENERRAWIKGDGSVPAELRGCAWWNLHGLRVSSTDSPEGSTASALVIRQSEHVTLRRLLAHNSNRTHNGPLIGINQSRHVLVEETEIYFFHRNGIEAMRSDDVTFRRCYGNSRGHSDIPGGYGSHEISRDGGDRTFVGYYASDFLVENCVSEGKNEGFGGISGFRTASGRQSAERLRFLGVVSLDDNVTGAVQSRIKEADSEPVRGAYFKDFLMIGSRRGSFTSRAVVDLTMENVTAWDVAGPVFRANLERQELGRTIWPSCEEIGGCTIRLRNWRVGEVDGPVLEIEHARHPKTDLLLEGWEFSGVAPGNLPEPVNDDGGMIRHSRLLSGADTEPGCLVRGEGAGATILYRYQDGELTADPLWDPSTGSFPHGAVVVGMNDLPGASLFDFHERVGIGRGACALPS
jgi:hypothetical protein